MESVNNDTNTTDIKSPLSNAKAGFSNLYRKFQSIDPTEAQSHDSIFSLSVLAQYSFILGFLLISSLLIFLYIVPQYNNYVVQKDELSKIEVDYNKVHAQYEYLNGLASLQSQLDENISISKESIPLNEDIPQFMNQITVIADESEVILEKNDFAGVGSGATEASRGSSISVSVAIRGTYDQIKKFFELAESSRRLIKIGKIEVQKYKQQPAGNTPTESLVYEMYSDDPLFDVSFVCNGYYLPDPELASLKTEDFVKGSNYDEVLDRIKSMKYYPLVVTEETAENDSVVITPPAEPVLNESDQTKTEDTNIIPE